MCLEWYLEQSAWVCRMALVCIVSILEIVDFPLSVPNSTLRRPISPGDNRCTAPVSVLYKSIVGRCRPVRVADGPM